jgi:hypothetical protein
MEREMNAVVTDPYNVQEIFAAGPFNINITGPIATITFTHLRPDVHDILAGKSPAGVQAVVVARIVMPADGLAEFRNVLNKMMREIVPGSETRN